LSEKVAPNVIEAYRREQLVDDDDFLARPGLQYWETDKYYTERLPDYRLARRLRFSRWIEVPSAVPPSSSKVGEHVQWLAECQVRGRDEAEVARSAGLVGAAGTMKVRRAIHVLAQLIGLSLSTKTARATTPHTARDAPASEITARDIDATLPRGSQPEFRTRVAFCTRQRSGTPSTNSSRAGLPSCAGSFSTKSSRVVT
jgi:hypothetical protein